MSLSSILLMLAARFREDTLVASRPPAGSDALHRGDRHYAEDDGSLATLCGPVGGRLWVRTFDSAHLTAGWIAYGNSTGGVTGDSRWIRSGQKVTLIANDGQTLFELDGAATARSMNLGDVNARTVFNVDTRLASRSISWFDSNAGAMAYIDQGVATRAFTLYDDQVAPVPMWRFDQRAINRSVSAFDPFGAAIVTIDTTMLSRSMVFRDDGGMTHVVIGNSSAPFSRVFTVNDSGGFAILHINSAAATRTFEISDSAGGPILSMQTIVGTRTIVLTSSTGGVLATVDTVNATANWDWGMPYKPRGYNVASLPAGNEREMLWAINGRKTGEGPGAGTGVPVYFSNGQWRVFYDDSVVVA